MKTHKAWRDSGLKWTEMVTFSPLLSFFHQTNLRLGHQLGWVGCTLAKKKTLNIERIFVSGECIWESGSISGSK